MAQSILIPFPENAAINKQQLLIPNSQNLPRATADTHNRINKNIDRKAKAPLSYLPGCPHVSLELSTVSTYIHHELATPILDELYSSLWFVARKSGDHVDPLHLQLLKGRRICLTENAQLHLLWTSDCIYIKPLPTWLLNYQVWDQYFCGSSKDESARSSGGGTMKKQKSTVMAGPILRESSEAYKQQNAIAQGFIRSYTYLIQHESDFKIAHQHHLLPSNLDWITWMHFASYFQPIPDQQVSMRYHYGQIRLSRLHWAVRICRPPSAMTMWFYYLPHWSMSPYLKSILAPLAFVFVTTSLVLSAMQVVAGFSASDLNLAAVNDRGLELMKRAFLVFSVGLMLFVGCVWTLSIIIPGFIILWQVGWGFRCNRRLIGKKLGGVGIERSAQP